MPWVAEGLVYDAQRRQIDNPADNGKAYQAYRISKGRISLTILV
jgi:hypothetical protein